MSIAVPATSANLGAGFDIFALALHLQNEVEAWLSDGDDIVVQTESRELLDLACNAVVAGWRHACSVLGVDAGGVVFRTVDRIPLRRGLGSSAAAHLAGVMAANALHLGGWDEHGIIAQCSALEGHPDNVAAALLGGLTICAPGAPAVRMDVPEELSAVVFVPDMELPTAAARSVVPVTLSRADALFNAGRCALLVRAMALRDWDTLREAMEDRWHQQQRTALFPALPDLIAAAYEGGARGAALSGAGSSVLALVDDRAVAGAVAEAMSAAAHRLGVRGSAQVLQTRNWGARIDVHAA